MNKSKLNYKILKEHLDFLIKNNLVEERALKKENLAYAISPKGLSVLKSFKEVKKVFQTEDENRLETMSLE